MEQDQRLQQETEREKTQAERLASGYYERGKLLETSSEYGAVYTANVMLPDGRLGATERRSRFELREVEENKIEVVLRQRLYYRGDDIEPKELANRFVPRSEGKFGQLDEAQKHVEELIRGYEQTVAEEEYGFRRNDRRDRQNGVKPAAQLTNQEIVAEARALHAQFQALSERFDEAPPSQRAEIRQEMAPVVDRERELRREFTGRVDPELTRDRAPARDMSFSR
jgi:hypothetical protein